MKLFSTPDAFLAPRDDFSLGAGVSETLTCVKSKTEGAAKFCMSIKKNLISLGFRVRRFRFLVDFGLSGRNVKEAVGSKREPAEYGWHFKLTDELFVEPQAEVT